MDRSHSDWCEMVPYSGFDLHFSDLQNPGIKSRSPTLQVDSLPVEPPGKPISICNYKKISEKQRYLEFIAILGGWILKLAFKKPSAFVIPRAQKQNNDWDKEESQCRYPAWPQSPRNSLLKSKARKWHTLWTNTKSMYWWNFFLKPMVGFVFNPPTLYPVIIWINLKDATFEHLFILYHSL